MIELRHLRAVVAIAEEGHLTRAAERLGIQQPPLTRLLRAMEDDLGARLFERHPKGMRLTEAGQSMLEGAHDALRRVEGTVDTVRRTSRGLEGKLAIGFTSSAMCHPVVPATVRQFRRNWPDVALALKEGNSAELLPALSDGGLDAAFVRAPSGNLAGLVVETILEEQMIVALPKGHRLSIRPPKPGLALSVLAEEEFVLYHNPSNPGLYEIILGACRDSGFAPRIGQEAPQMLSTLNLVAAGLGVSLVPNSMRRLDGEHVAYVPLAKSSRFTARLCIAFRSMRMAGAKLNFIQRVRKTARHVRAA